MTTKGLSVLNATLNELDLLNDELGKGLASVAEPKRGWLSVVVPSTSKSTAVYRTRLQLKEFDAALDRFDKQVLGPVYAAIREVYVELDVWRGRGGNLTSAEMFDHFMTQGKLGELVEDIENQRKLRISGVQASARNRWIEVGHDWVLVVRRLWGIRDQIATERENCYAHESLLRAEESALAAESMIDALVLIQHDADRMVQALRELRNDIAVIAEGNG